MSDNRSDLSSMLGKVISNPEAMQTIMKIAGELKDAKPKLPKQKKTIPSPQQTVRPNRQPLQIRIITITKARNATRRRKIASACLSL